MNKFGRIHSLDGYRAIAALGVVWIHVWASFGNPSLRIAGIDFYRLIAILGNGVDLFFVISGFCMYLVYHKQDLTFATFTKFVEKRWKRIAPAYYVAVMVYGCIWFNEHSSFPLIPSLISHFLFYHTFVPDFEISAPFWSIAVEWHFYIILPFILFFKNKFGLSISIIIFSLLSIAAGFHFYYSDPEGWSKFIDVRLIEFLWGMLIANLYLNAKNLKTIGSGTFSRRPVSRIIFGFLLAYLGRLLSVTEVIEKVGEYGWVVKAFAFPIMTLGFSIMILNTIAYPDTYIAKFLSTRIFTFLGKISYSIYLWHSLVLSIFDSTLIKYYGVFGQWASILGFISVCIITIPLSFISYQLFEAFYFRKGKSSFATVSQ